MRATTDSDLPSEATTMAVPKSTVTQDTEGWVRTSTEQRRLILAQFENSGMSATQFARRGFERKPHCDQRANVARWQYEKGESSCGSEAVVPGYQHPEGRTAETCEGSLKEFDELARLIRGRRERGDVVAHLPDPAHLPMRCCSARDMVRLGKVGDDM